MKIRVLQIIILILFLLTTQISIPTTAHSSGALSFSHKDNSSQIQHKNPELEQSTNNRIALRTWLRNRLQTKLERSLEKIQKGQYNESQEILDEEFYNLLDKYKEISINNRTLNNTNYEKLADKQYRLANYTNRYQETHQEYERTKVVGNSARARVLARRLERQSSQIIRLTNSIDNQYKNSSMDGNGNSATPQSNLSSIRTSISTSRSELLENNFVLTQLNVSIAPQTISYRQPGIVHGHLKTINGSDVANQSITVRIGSQNFTTITNESGNFKVEYRPISVSPGKQTLRIQTFPINNHSVYFGTEANVTINVRQESPVIEISSAPTSGGFGEFITVTGHVYLDGTEVGGAPLKLSLGGVTIASTVTSFDGEFELTGKIPPGITSGKKQLNVSIRYENISLEKQSSNRQFIIFTKRTSIRILDVESSSQKVTLIGKLTTIDGISIPQQPVQITSADRKVQEILTNTTGFFRVTIPQQKLEYATIGNDSPQLTVTFNGTHTNLDSSRQPISFETQNQMGVPNTDQSNQFVSYIYALIKSNILAFGLILLIIFSSVVGILRYQSVSNNDNLSSQDSRDPSANPSHVVETINKIHQQEQISSQFQEYIESGDFEEAVEMVYTYVRKQLQKGSANSTAHTHWEFYTSCETKGFENDVLDPFYDLTITFEKAIFSPEKCEETDAENAYDLLEQIM